MLNEYVGYIACFLGTVFNILVLCKIYEKLVSNYSKRFKLSFLVIVLLLISSVFIYLLNFYFNTGYKIFYIFFSLVIFFKMIFKDSFYEVLLKAFIIYLFMFIFDFFVSIIFMLTPYIQNLITSSFYLTKAFCTFVVSLLLLGMFNIKFIIKVINKFIQFLIDNKNYVLLLFTGFVFLVLDLIVHNHAVKATFTTYIFSILLIIFFLGLLSILISQYFKNKNNLAEQKMLLTLMNDYEMILEKDRELRHEILNNLVILKSYKAKNTKEYEKLLDDIIDEYQNNKSNNYAKLYNLPAGIKGMVYYKIFNIRDKNIIFNTNIDSSVHSKLEKLDIKLYYKINKVLGILLDNAIEACLQADNKNVMIDIYLDEDVVFIYVENSFVGNINIADINKKGFSSKGKNRGYGLYIVKKIIKENQNLEFEQYIYKERFVSILKINV